jgi:hypothetical protein
VRGDVVHPGHEACPIICGVEDDVWLPYVGREGLLLITRDKRIRRRLVEKQALVKHSVKALIMTQSGNSSMQASSTWYCGAGPVSNALPTSPARGFGR